MKLRPFDYATDLPPVLQLFTQGLSRTGNEDWFNWKHRDNPFGPSPGFLAELDGRIVAARFFLRWRFRNGTKMVETVRPVDTVVHPSARRRGVFTKLTMYGLQQIYEGGDGPVFNTPNAKSLPGYLKMGWKVYDHPLPYCYRLRPPLVGSGTGMYTGTDLPSHLPTVQYGPSLTTERTEEFINWRYADARYRFAYPTETSSALLVYRQLHIRNLKVLSVVDYVGPVEQQQELVFGAAAREGCYLVHSLAGSPAWPVGARGVRLVRGSSIVAIRGGHDFTAQSFSFSPGDLEDVL